MFRLSSLRKDKSKRQSVDVCELSRPRVADRPKERLSTRPRSVAVPKVAVRTSHPVTTEKAPLSAVSEITAYYGWDVPHLTKTPWELERSKKHSTRKQSRASKEFPKHVFENLPREIYHCIVSQLNQMYLGDEKACSSCYLGDLHSLSLTSRAWEKAARALLYRKVLVLTNEDHAKLPKLKIIGTSRLKLLRRTLRERPRLAQRVRDLHLSDFQTLYQSASIEREEIVNLIASLVMASPRLERLVGFHVPFSHSFDRLSHALSTRPNLKERVWLLENADGNSAGHDDDELSAHYIAECDPTERFLELNANHTLLSTLLFHQDPDQASTSLNFRAIVGTLRNSPNLRHVSISGLAATAFTNLALNSLPGNLKSLRLENLPGVSDKGIQRFATSQLAASIERLTLINLEIDNLFTISSILSSHLVELKEFSIVQDKAPTLSGRVAMPDFVSQSLRYIHWELRSEASLLPSLPSSSSLDLVDLPSFPFTNQEPICCLATSLLAASIKDNAFPSLRRICIPHDPQGVVQALCKPLSTALLPSDTSKFATAPRISKSNGFSIILDERVMHSPKVQGSSAYAVSFSSLADSAIGSSTFSSRDEEFILTPLRSRLAAQSRILFARKNAAITVRVFDPEGEVRVNKVIGGYIGHVGSKITYDLRADGDKKRRLNAEPGGWITGICDLVGELEDDSAIRSGHHWGSCGHRVGGRVGGNVVRVKELF
ncbi:hypothetical protein EJ02DRAFT_472252 [Clathrospora elynae]|uniref:F-box domain-containing protein n=1 Tax=Clathrospora elynae TaxID=706981 RepID=A0A6A5T6P6_9PLEO|nr:hypothetical protein EJ02DRAFT_472252 [Clathrospora elynae]